MIRTPESLVVGSGGPSVIVTGRVAAFLLRYAELETYHRHHRGEDAEVDTTLIALKVVALQWRGSATGTTEAARPELVRSSEWVGTRAAATQLGMTDSGVRKAIREGRLKAVTVAGNYRINREQLAHFKARKKTQ